MKFVQPSGPKALAPTWCRSMQPLQVKGWQNLAQQLWLELLLRHSREERKATFCGCSLEFMWMMNTAKRSLLFCASLILLLRCGLFLTHHPEAHKILEQVSPCLGNVSHSHAAPARRTALLRRLMRNCLGPDNGTLIVTRGNHQNNRITTK